MAIVERLDKGSALTHAELDGNFTTLVAEDDAIKVRLDSLEDTLWAHGIENHDSTLTALSLSSGVSTKLLNNSSGAVTNLTRKIPGRGTVWDTSANQFNWDDAGLLMGDTVYVRLDLEIDTSFSNTELELTLDVGIGSASAFTIRGARKYFKSSGTYTNEITEFHIFIGDNNVRDFPAEIKVITGDSGVDITLNGHYLVYNLQNPVLIA